MPRSISEILAHADELAAEFEAWEPDPSQETTTPEMRLRRAGWARAQAEVAVAEAVAAARDDHVPWRTIGDALGTSAQAAQRRYNKVVHLDAKTTKTVKARVTKKGRARRAASNPAASRSANLVAAKRQTSRSGRQPGVTP